MIRTFLQLASAVLVVTALVALPGCGDSQSKTPPAKSGHYEGDGHDHSKDKDAHEGHDHDQEKEGEHK